MSTKRNSNIAIERKGIRFIQSIVEDNDCIFHEIDLRNDQGNDCYIELINDNVATGFTVLAQIKSGKSYKDKSGYKIPADNAHLTYWSNCVNPVVGIVYDKEKNQAYWENISEYLKNHPDVLLQEHHTIRISQENVFDNAYFEFFIRYFIDYIKAYKSFENYGRSLNQFSQVEAPSVCYEGLKSLFSNHRDRNSSWFYIIANFGKIAEIGIHKNILGMLGNFAENPHIFWHRGNMEYYPSNEMSNFIADLVNKYFDERCIKIAISFLKEGVVRGSFPFLVYLVLCWKKDIHVILRQIMQKDNLEEDERNLFFWLYIHFAHRVDVNNTILEIEQYLANYPDDNDNYLFQGMMESIKNDGFIQIG